MSRVKNQKKANSRIPNTQKKPTTISVEHHLFLAQIHDEIDALVNVYKGKIEEVVKAHQIQEDIFKKEKEQQTLIENLQRQLRDLQLEKETRENQQKLHRIEKQEKYPTKEETKYDEKINDDDCANTCVICLENRRVCTIQPCKHFSLCISCASIELSECPQCRTPITYIERVFL